MPFCTKCGAQFKGDGLLCPSCKASADQNDTATDPFEKITGAFHSVEDHTESFDSKDIATN